MALDVIDIESLRVEHETVFGDRGVPAWVVESLTAYVREGRPTGDTLAAFLSNDLLGAVTRCDISTARAFVAIAGFIYRHVPAVAKGSPENVRVWIAEHAKRRAQAKSDGDAS